MAKQQTTTVIKRPAPSENTGATKNTEKTTVKRPEDERIPRGRSRD